MYNFDKKVSTTKKSKGINKCLGIIHHNDFDEELVTFKFKHPDRRITSMLYTGASNEKGEKIYVLDTEKKDVIYII